MINVNNIVKNIIEYNYCSNQNKDIVNICYGIDNNFARCTASSIISFVQNNLDVNFRFNLIVGALSDTNKIRFKNFAEKYKLNIIIYEIDSIDFERLNLPTKKQWPISMYFRCLFPLILSNVNKIFYIDADIICLNSAKSLFNVDLDNKIVGAVKGSEWGNKYRNKALGLKNHIYFNSGVLVIDVIKWNKYDISTLMIKELIKSPDKFELPDQDVLNLVLTGNVKYLETKYNWFNHLHADVSTIKRNEIVLIHFTASPKPWNKCWQISKICNDFNKNIYSYYEKMTPWANDELLDPKLKEEQKEYLKYLLKHLKMMTFFKYLYRFFITI